ncbi:MAG: hypothetical protein AUJ71_00015 [Candidatus Omnitrophica bacterium CG1_02_49_16]|nr:MAG: hypothetical protein AUJ71_00015 [Candidatus Omnitrophica bacterium CG1_02_49_16]
MRLVKEHFSRAKQIVLVLTMTACVVFLSQQPGRCVTDEIHPLAGTAIGITSNETPPVKNIRPRPFGNKPFGIFSVYTDYGAHDSHYTPSGKMGDYWDITPDEQCTTRPHSGVTCIKITYTNRASQKARWAGLYWQDPKSNWGDIPGGYDLTGAKKLTFWVRGEHGGERIDQFKIGGMSGKYGDSDWAVTTAVVLTPEWQQVTIDLEGKDLSVICGGFCCSLNLDWNRTGATFYLDDIRFE